MSSLYSQGSLIFHTCSLLGPQALFQLEARAVHWKVTLGPSPSYKGFTAYETLGTSLPFTCKSREIVAGLTCSSQFVAPSSFLLPSIAPNSEYSRHLLR